MSWSHLVSRLTLRQALLALAYVGLPFFILLWVFWGREGQLLAPALRPYLAAGDAVLTDLVSLPALTLTEDSDAFTLRDTVPDTIQIQSAGQGDQPAAENTFELVFPKDYGQPLEIKLDGESSVYMKDLGGNGRYTAAVKKIPRTGMAQEDSRSRGTSVLSQFWQKLFPAGQGDETPYLTYTDAAERKMVTAAYQKDQATGEKRLKEWVLYSSGTGEERESYSFQNALLKLLPDGQVAAYFSGQGDLSKEVGSDGVDSNLLARAAEVLARESRESILSGNQPAAFVIPRPYIVDREGVRTDLDWEVSDTHDTLSVTIRVGQDDYPLALDPTLAFSAPGQSNTGTTISGEASSQFGYSLTAGDWNADGKTDLAVGAYAASTSTGRAYLFYNDGTIPTTAATADIILTGEASSQFGYAMAAGDFNADGRIDLSISANTYSANTGRAYIFYNDGSIPTTAATADVIITGQAGSDFFGGSLSAGDFNADGKTDLTVGAYGYSGGAYTGRAYLFYSDGSIPTAAASADAIITGQTMLDLFSTSLIAGDFNADGKTDLAIGAPGYISLASTGRVYIFYNGSIITENASGADVIITGEASSYFGYSFAAGDWNADGKIDLAVGATSYSSSAGRAYIFYGGSIITEAATGADVIITGEANSQFGSSLVAADFNADSRIDLVVSAPIHTSDTGRAYIFYNDGSIPTTAATADVVITGEAGSALGVSLAAADFNADGKTDLAVGASAYSTQAGRAYIFYSQNGQVNTNLTLTGEAGSQFGRSLTSGDFNADGKTDLAVGASTYSSQAGRAYIFYNGSIITEAATGADIIITGEASSVFGASLTSGDFNADGKTDLAVAATGSGSVAGRAYIFYNGSIITEAATGADIFITAGTSSVFGASLTSGDFNADGKTDLAVGATPSGAAGSAYIFYGGSIITEAATGADVIITGETSSQLGTSFAAGDFNADGKTDLAVGASTYSTNVGRAYIFYNGSIITEAATGADIILTGETGSIFGNSLTAGDFNADGKTDLAVGGRIYSTQTGRAYIFYGGSIITEAATGADIILTGEASSQFGQSLVAGDFNADGKTDLAVGAHIYSSSLGRIYIFYNDGSIPTTALTADIIITGGTSSGQFGYSLASGDFNADGKTDLAVAAPSSSDTVHLYETQENFAWNIVTYNSSFRVGINGTGQELTILGEASSSFGTSLTSGDFNADGETDLAVGASAYSSNAGRAYIFYNDGAIPITAATANIILTGEASSQFGISLAAGDWNADGKTDLAVGANTHGTSAGRAYLFYNGSIITEAATGADIILTGEASSAFGVSLTSGDFNADGETDLAVGANTHGTSAGRAYIFYNGSIITEAATGADIIITGESGYFGTSLTSGDFNADGKTDLAVGALSYNASTGRTYIIISEENVVPIYTRVATGTDPAGATIAPGAGATMAGAFTVVTDEGTDAITQVTVGLGSGVYTAISLVEITSDNGVTAYGSTVSPGSDTPFISLSGLTATTSATQYKIRITPLSHASMPAPPGGSYTLTAQINSWAGTNAKSGSDTAGTTITIDNASPASATAYSTSPGANQVTLNWTTSASADISRSVILRWTGTVAGAEVPMEGTDYSVGNTISTATVVCVRTGETASTAVNGTDGGGGSCSAVALPSQYYMYKVFQKDTRGNYDSGQLISPVWGGAANTDLNFNGAWNLKGDAVVK